MVRMDSTVDTTWIHRRYSLSHNTVASSTASWSKIKNATTMTRWNTSLANLLIAPTSLAHFLHCTTFFRRGKRFS